MTAMLQDGSEVSHAAGRIDDWCVYVTEPDGQKKAPLDFEYFQALRAVADVHGAEALFSVYLDVYDRTGERVERDVLDLITQRSRAFGEHEKLVERTLTIIYYAMVSEQNKRPESRWPMKKRAKKIGVYETLVLGYEPQMAASSTKGVPYREQLRRLAAYEKDEARFRRVGHGGFDSRP